MQCGTCALGFQCRVFLGHACLVMQRCARHNCRSWAGPHAPPFFHPADQVVRAPRSKQDEKDLEEKVHAPIRGERHETAHAGVVRKEGHQQDHPWRAAGLQQERQAKNASPQQPMVERFISWCEGLECGVDVVESFYAREG